MAEEVGETGKHVGTEFPKIGWFFRFFGMVSATWRNSVTKGGYSV